MENNFNDYDSGNYTIYNPLYEYTGVTPNKVVKEYISKKSYNEYEFIDTSGNKLECYKKFITLVDYVKFLIGKYKSNEIYLLPSTQQTPDISDNIFRACIQCPHNYAYVDGFFYYITSQLKKQGFQHGIELYDSYICIKNNFEIDIADDFEYIGDSNFFNEKLNQLFHFKDEYISSIFKKDSKLEPIQISEEDIDLDFDNIESEDKTLEEKVEEKLDEKLDEIVLELDDLKIDTDENDDTIQCKNINNDEDNSDVDYSDEEDINETEWETDDEEDEEGEEDEYEDDESSFHGSMEDELQKLILVINQIPTQVIAIEKCQNTFDSLLDVNDIKIEELESAIFQIIVILYVYQNIFKFTHNDLHTNNIMFVPTDQEFLTYKIKGQVFKIPSFGRLFKIIDFGRAIYTVNDKIVCSDSFSENGMAHTQYNFEPFYNSNKPMIHPNYSFDLCRLACSMLDFIIDDLDDLEKFKEIPIYNLIISWIYDDNGINILYKRNGEERYPDFKLYKMISRIVHNHVPEKQFEHSCFKKFISTDTETITMDLDNLIKGTNVRL
jgi:hypothetical protein